MKALFFTFLCISISTFLPAQVQLERQVIASAGGFGHHPASGISLSWTLGEVAVATLETPEADIILTQGFQQPDTLNNVVSNQELIQELGLTIFPNPVDLTLHIRLAEMPPVAVRVRLADQQGRVLQEKILNSTTLEFQMAHLPNGLYLLLFLYEDQLFSRKVLKM